MLFELLVMRYKAVLAQPTPWITDTIGSNLFFALHRAEVLLVLELRITYPSSSRPLSSMIRGSDKLVNGGWRGSGSSLPLLLAQSRVVYELPSQSATEDDEQRTSFNRVVAEHKVPQLQGMN